MFFSCINNCRVPSTLFEHEAVCYIHLLAIGMCILRFKYKKVYYVLNTKKYMHGSKKLCCW